MKDASIRVFLFNNSYGSFVQTLKEEELRYHESGVGRPSLSASGYTIELLAAIGGVTLIPKIAEVLIAWISTRPSRKVIIQTSDKNTIRIEGYSVKEVEEILERTNTISVIDMLPPDDV